MTRYIYVNGRYLPYRNATVHAEDRGFQFADAIYEVIEVKGGRLVDERRHMERLHRSLKELSIPAPMPERALAHVMRETVRRNRVESGTIYLQVSRGTAPRDFYVPSPQLRPTLVCIARRGNIAKTVNMAETGIAVCSAPDIRWSRCDIKTVMLLPAVLAKEQARSHGARDAWLVDKDGYVTEGASNNAWIVTKAGEIITRALGREILPGVTRLTVMDVIAAQGLKVTERAFTLEEAYDASEAFYTAASGTVMPVIKIDDHIIGDGHPGKIANLLRQKFYENAEITDS